MKMEKRASLVTKGAVGRDSFQYVLLLGDYNGEVVELTEKTKNQVLDMVTN